MRHSSDRAQVYPLAALVAVLAVTAGIVVYAGTLENSLRTQPDRETAHTTLDSVARTLQTAGVVDPGRLDETADTIPDGWHVNVSLRADGRRWARGPVPASESLIRSASRRVSVRVAPTVVRPGRLQVVLWR